MAARCRTRSPCRRSGRAGEPPRWRTWGSASSCRWHSVRRCRSCRRCPPSAPPPSRTAPEDHSCSPERARRRFGPPSTARSR
eukprot:scaffold1102_cov256-Pinguiococcus_pyrenoidosus.AAC.38